MQLSRLLHRWVIGCLIAYVIVIGIVVLTPVSYAKIVNGISAWVRSDLGITFFGAGWIEFAGNVVMFIPLGFLLTLLFRHPWYGTTVAILLSAGVEVAQIVIPDRVPTARDVISNSIGAAVGALLAWLLVRYWMRKYARAAAADS